MLILGLNLGHDPSAALLDARGVVLAAAHEARLTRVKKERRFPRLGIASVLHTAGRAASEVTVVAYSGYDNDTLRLVRDKYLCGVGDLRKSVGDLLRDELTSLGLGQVEVVREDHHFAHACAAQMACVAPDALVVTSDGYGDGASFTVRRSRDGRVPEDASVAAPVDASLGLVYQYVTGGLGYSMLSEEWKVLGLEPYGEPKGAAALFSDLIEGDCGIGSWRAGKLAPWSIGDEAWQDLPVAERRNALRRYMELNVPRFDRSDVASAVQRFVESRLVYELERLKPEPGTSLALAGGTFLNVKLNRLLGELEWVADVSVFPAAGDGGNAVGAALAYLQRVAPNPPRQGLESVYWGHDYGGAGEVCSAAALEADAIDEPEAIDRLATAVAAGRIVAIARGRGEFGPRALLNRSFVCRADRGDLAELLTRGLRRDPVMPYGCSMLESEVGAALSRPGPLAQCLRFMTGAPLVRHEFGRRYRAICHAVAGGGLSTRPHVVPDGSSWQARFLKAVGEKTGGAVVLNTSFNLHGEPIVETPADALDSFRQAAFPGSVLLLGGRVVSLEAVERAGHSPARPVAPLRFDGPRRRREACVCLVFGARDDVLAELKEDLERLGLRVLAERPISEGDSRSENWREGHALMVVGSESLGLVKRWADGLYPRDGLTVVTAASNAETSDRLNELFPGEVGRRAGAFADLLLWPGATHTTHALDLLQSTSSLTLVGLLYEPEELLRAAHDDQRVAASDVVAVFGTSIDVPPPLGGRMYLYAPEGRAALGRLVRRLGQHIQERDFLHCRRNGLVLVYSPPAAPQAPLEDALSRVLEWEIDGLVAVHPSLGVDVAEQLERFAWDRDLAVVGGSDCAVSERALRPLGVGAGGLSRFVNRFPGLEL
jgi:carbamoyltransferase